MAKKKSVRKTATNKTVAVSKKPSIADKVEVRILKPVFAKYRIVAEVGHIKKVHSSQVDEMVKNGDAELT